MRSEFEAELQNHTKSIDIIQTHLIPDIETDEVMHKHGKFLLAKAYFEGNRVASAHYALTKICKSDYKAEHIIESYLMLARIY